MKLRPTVRCVKVDSQDSTFPSFHRSCGSAGFTLVEVIVAMSIAMLLVGVASLSITAVSDENELRRAAASIEMTARDSLLQAVSDYRPVQLELASFGAVQVRRYGEKNFRAPASGETWEFSPTGVCEPVELRITSEAGTIELGFDPLTGCARKRNIIVNG
jgi:type II secretory pathway pseudopilin PulG